MCTTIQSNSIMFQEAENEWRLNTGAIPKPEESMSCYVMGTSITKANDKYWSPVSNHKFDSEGEEAFNKLSLAKTACAAADDCTGVVKHDDDEDVFHLGTSRLLTPASGYQVYIMAGDAVKTTSVEISFDGYTWQMKKPMTLSGKIGDEAYETRNEALKVIVTVSVISVGMLHGFKNTLFPFLE